MDDESRPQSPKSVAAVAALNERIRNLEGRLDSAHKRIDKLEAMIREDFKEIKADLKAISESIQPIRDWMNRGKGWAAATLLLAGMVGGVIVKGLGFALGK